MRIAVNGVRLFVDIEGSALVPAGERMEARPTIVLVHGGPGADHTHYKPLLSPLAEHARLVFYDHRGNGRSEGDDPKDWTLAQWADDLNGLIEALGLERPIVLGTSFGGFVAQEFATRYPDSLSKLVLISTAAQFDFEAVYAAFERIAGPKERDIARSYWSNPTDASRAEYGQVCAPHYTVKRENDWIKRVLMRNATALHFNGPSNEHGRMDFRAALEGLTCPVLLLAGQEDPITPIAFAEVIAEHVPPELLKFHRFDRCGHGVVADRPEALDVIRDFVMEGWDDS